MKGDFTRFTHDPVKHYSGVLKQQGRVDLDADWNEYVQIQSYLAQIETRDVIGCCGVPNSHPRGFKIERVSGEKLTPEELKEEAASRKKDRSRLKVNPGRIYVDGLLCESDRAQVLPNPREAGVYLAYLDVWQRHITFVEDPDLPEIALGGVDTTTRVKTEWQVRFANVSDKVKQGHLDCKPFACSKNPWEPIEAVSTGRLAAKAEEAEGEELLCKVQDQAGYRGLENRLYRVEIHSGGEDGHATFKWSRDNGAVVFPVKEMKVQGSKSTITLKQAGKDDVLTLHIGDWVEVLGDKTDLALKSGTMAQVASESDGTDIAKGIVVLMTDLSAHQKEGHLKIRRWDQKENSKTHLNSGVIKVKEDEWTPLESGVEVCFKSGAYQVGDYWMIPARTKVRDVLWPETDGQPDFVFRHGVEHHYCALALIEFDGRTWGEPRDCRHLFPPLTEVTGDCCTPVNPGDDVQQAVDSAIAAGGGCICLCQGTHLIEGPLKLIRARNLTIHGENASTILQFKGTSEAGEGGILLSGCNGVAFKDMAILGDGVSALISTQADEKLNLNLNIALDHLTLVNRTTAVEKIGGNCAVRLGQAIGITIEHCRLTADIGIVSLLGNDLPEYLADDGSFSFPAGNISYDSRSDSESVEIKKASRPDRLTIEEVVPETETFEPTAETDYRVGVNQLLMRDSAIRYRRFGIWALKSVEWRLDNCRFEPVSAVTEAVSSEEALQSHRIEADATASKLTGTAIQAFIWKDSAITRCHLTGRIGLNIIAWLGGEASNNTITAKHAAIVLWLCGAKIESSDINSMGGAGIGFGASFRASVTGNKVRGAGIALGNESLDNWLGGVNSYLQEIVGMYRVGDEQRDDRYEWMALWMLMEEVCRSMGLVVLRDRFQQFLNSFEAFKDVPVLLLASAQLYPRLEAIAKRLGNLPMPVVALRVAENDLEATRAVIRLLDFIPVGGMRIAENRLQTLLGQAIQVKAHKVAVNPQVIFIGLRYLPEILTLATRALAERISGLNLIKAWKEPLSGIFQEMDKLLESLLEQSKSIMESDCRIESNSIRSRLTAIESNIFELAIEDNHITLEESPVADEEITDIIKALEQSASTKNLAVGMRQGSKIRMEQQLVTMKMAGTSAAAKKMRRDTEKAADTINRRTSNEELKTQTAELSQAADSMDIEKMEDALGKIVETISGYVNTCGIWVKGAGCRIVGNQVLVPPDADEQTWAQGGIRFWDDEGTPIWLILLADDLLKLYKPGLQLPSLLVATETLIDNNEVIRGTGHGIEIGGIKNMPLGLGLVDLKLRGNQVRDMAGSGIFFREESLTVGVDIEGNRILDCGSLTSRSVFASEKGGILVRNAASCRVHGNRVRCSSNLNNGIGLFGIDLRTISGLSLTDNHIQHSEVSNYQLEINAGSNLLTLGQSYRLAALALASLCGGVKLSEMSGESRILNNEILLFHGTGGGLVLGNIDTGADWGLWLQKAVVKVQEAKKSAKIGLTEAIIVGGTDQLLTASASIQGNHFESALNRPFYAFLVANLKDLNFSGNNVRAQEPTTAPGAILNVGRGIVSHNMFDIVDISMGSGVIAANCSSQAIVVPAGVTAGLNTP
ncbi:MAG: DUF6519 domain-containing protein [Dehalococcoidia bacterium]|nr:DUF6519 domain-containing protein [Dehalococcoidia bacterium]